MIFPRTRSVYIQGQLNSKRLRHTTTKMAAVQKALVFGTVIRYTDRELEA